MFIVGGIYMALNKNFYKEIYENETMWIDMINSKLINAYYLIEIKEFYQKKQIILNDEFEQRGWDTQPPVFDKDDDAYAKFDFLKDRIGVEVQFGHSSFIGIDLLKFQVASFSNLDTIDFGVYITTTAAFQKELKSKYGLKWEGSLTFEKVVRYLPYIRSAIQVPIYVIGIDV